VLKLDQWAALSGSEKRKNRQKGHAHQKNETAVREQKKRRNWGGEEKNLRDGEYRGSTRGRNCVLNIRKQGDPRKKGNYERTAEKGLTKGRDQGGAGKGGGEIHL